MDDDLGFRCTTLAETMRTLLDMSHRQPGRP